MQCFKVVRVCDDHFISFCTYNDCGLDYRLGEETVAEIGGILAFDTLQHALDFMDERDVFKDTVVILEGFGEPMELPKKRSILLSKKDVVATWNNGRLSFTNQAEWMSNTVAVKTFTPQRVVWTDEQNCRKNLPQKRKPKEQL